ncbi:MAG: ATP-binding protein [bacterium]|jgi:ATP-dependent DNA helicase RecG
MTALRTYLQVRYEFPSEAGEREGAAALQRVEVWEYPLTALREAVANALLHRDYTDTGRVMIRVYDDHILISSPGPLPEGLTVSDLSRDPHRSRLRNPLLAQAFFCAEIVERWGTGTTRMAQLCAAHGLPAPEFAEVSGEVWVTFHKDPYTDERLKAMGLSARQIQAVRYVQQHGSISNAEYRDLTKLKERTASSDLADLIKRDIFAKLQETGRGARYRFKNPQNPQPTRNKPAMGDDDKEAQA